jgi:glycosyltransferase involved in cell wall biosynthesis
MSNRISVVIPAYNCARYLGEAIGSALAQEPRPLEIIVVDDGSSDGSGDIAASFGPPVLCIRQENQGEPGARNRALSAISGNWFASLDGDDVMPPGALARQLAVLDAHPDAWAISGAMQYFMDGADATDGARRRYSPLLIPLTVSTTLFRAEILTRIGPFDTRIPIGSDLDWLKRIREAGIEFVSHDGLVLQVRRHAANMTRHAGAVHAAFFNAIRSSLQRQRQIPESKPGTGLPVRSAEKGRE